MFSATTRPHRVLIILVVVVALAGGGWFVSTHWKRWAVQRDVARAEALLRSGMRDGAQIAALRALRADRENVPALRSLIDTVPVGNGNTDVLLRSRLADLAPEDVGNLERLAVASIQSGQYEIAARAIGDLARKGADEAKVVELQARFSIARDDHAAALRAARRLLELQPGSVAGRLIAALTQVRTEDEVARVSIEAELRALAEVPQVRVEALRGLREVLRKRQDFTGALAVAEQAVAAPRTNFTDALVRADLATEVDAEKLEPQLADLTKRAGGNVVALGLIGKWLRQQGRGDRLESWVEQTEALRRDVVTAQMIRVEALVAAKSWDQLAALLAPANWRDLEFLRHAFLARAARELGKPNEAEQEWRTAADGASEGKRPRVLAETTEGWPGWAAEWEKLLWAASRQPGNSAWALPKLSRHFEKQQDTRALRRVMDEWLLADSTFVPAKNNFAYYSLLLGTSLERAHRLAEETHAAFPNDAAIVSTRALSLIVLGRSAEALGLLEKLGAMERPGIVACRALALAGVGRKDEARTLAASVDEKQLLPELREKLREAVPPSDPR